MWYMYFEYAGKCIFAWSLARAPLVCWRTFAWPLARASFVWKWNFAWPLASKLNAKKAITGLTIVDVISCVNMFYELIS